MMDGLSITGDEQIAFNKIASFRTLSQEGKKSTGCVTIPRPKKSDHPFSEYPHVLYAKIWRWRDVYSKEELKHHPNCKFGFDLNKEFICVNPYHYRRVKFTLMPNDIESALLLEFDVPQIKPTEFNSPLVNNSSFSNPLIPSAATNSTENPPKLPDVLLSDPGSEKESNLCALLSAMSSEGGSAKDDYSSRENDTLSSTGSDDDFEIIDYDMVLEKETDGAPPKNNSTLSSLQSSPATKDESVDEELASLKVTITEPKMLSSLHSSLSPTTKDKSVEEELASLKFIDNESEMKPLIAAANNPLEESEMPKKNAMDEDSEDKPFENIAEPAIGKIIVCENNDEWKKKYEELQMKHEKLKTTFVEMGFAANDPANETPYKDVLKAMHNVKYDFLGNSTSSKQYSFLKAFLESCTIMSETNGTSGSSSSINTPYHRKFKPNWMSSARKKTLTSALSASLSANKTEPGASASCSKIPPVFTFTPSSKPSCSGNLLNNSFGWDPREPIPTVMIEHRPKSAPSNVQEQPKVNEGINQELNCNNQVSKDDADKVQMMEEITTLRNQVKNLEMQLEVQKQDEFEKMALYTNSLRDQYIKTVNGLIETNKVLSEKIAKQESQVTAHALEIPRLLDEKDREIDALNENLLTLSAILTKNEEEIQTLKKEKRKLKRNSESEEAEEEISSKIRRDSETEAETNDDPSSLHQHAFDSLLVQLKKCLENTPLNNVVSKEPIPSSNVLGKNDLPPPSESQQIDTLTSSLELFHIKEKEKALSTKLNDMTAELEVMKITHDKTKSDLEAKLKIGAKKYAQLYLKYDRMVKNCRTQN